MSNRMPERWLKYTAFGKRIPNTPFVAFKCPLKETMLQSLPSDAKFGLQEVRTQLPQVSLIIDLTNTKRYYDSKVLNGYGIDYEKIFVPGHDVPAEFKFNEFFHIVDTFIEKNKSNPEKMIGVHCTHGINRTGLFICSYMICKLGYSYENAVREFNSSRGHNIERENYVEELKKFEMEPLKFDSASYEKQKNKSRIPGLLQRNAKQIKPLMEVPVAPLVTPFRMLPKTSQRVPKEDGIKALMELPSPLIPPKFQYTHDPRPCSSINVRPSTVRPPFIAASRNECRGINRRYRKYKINKP